MEKDKFEGLIEQGVIFLSRFLTGKIYLYFPLLYSSVIWAMRRSKGWRERIFSWKIWLEPGKLESKPDFFILDFFKKDTSLSAQYSKEIEENDLRELRRAFKFLYPILGLEDPFLNELFQKELKSREYQKIVSEFRKRLKKVKEDIESSGERLRIEEGLRELSENIASLSIELFEENEVRKMIEKIVAKELKRNK